MSEISLRDYFAKLEQSLNTNAADEVIHHCRHILQFYPKNVTAYRFLGRALLMNGRWDEATAALRRVLSVIPDDYAAHIGLSEIYDHKKKADDAIWHLERAFEQNPNNSQLLDAVRALYRRYRDVDQAKVQLTAAAVARQALRNQQFEHAIDTLRDALERQPDRIDLSLLLSVALWESNDHVESAETALDVLQVLPDCLEANRILTKLWLEEDRPSDAQRYLNRVEAIDPYIAVEVAQGQAASDDAFRLEELDYVRSAQSELTVNRPDWLKDITAEVPQVDAGGEDWSNFASSMLASSANAQAQAEEEKPPVVLFGDDATSVVEIPSSPSAADDEEIPAEFAALSSGSFDDLTTLTPTPTAAAASNPNDPMAWLQGSGVELTDEEILPPFDAAQESLADDSSEALSWLQEDSPLEEAGASSRPMPDSEAFSWMQNYEVEMSEEFSPSALKSEPEPTAEEEVPDWLKDEDFLDEALGIEQLTGNDSPSEPDWLNLDASRKETANLPERTPPEMSPTTPMRDSIQNGGLLVDTDWLKDVSQDEPQPVPGPRRGLTAMLGEANFDWMKEQPAENELTSDAVMDEWLAQFGASEPKSEAPPVEHAPDWLTELDTTMPDQPHESAASEEPSDWLSGVGDAEPAEAAVSEDELSWMQDESEPAPAEVPDWLSELQPTSSSTSDTTEDEQPESADAFDWSGAEAVVEEGEPSGMPDWMAELEPTSTYETSSAVTFEREPSGEESEFEWLPEDGTILQKPTEEEAAEFAWLDEDAIAAKAEFASAESELQTDDELLSASESPAWSATSEAEFELDLDQADLPAEVPDWLSELKPQPQTQSHLHEEPVASLQDDDSWLDEEPVAAEETDDQPLAAEVPDWLSELKIQPEAQPASETEPVVASFEVDDSWLAAPAADEAAADDQPLAAEVPDWLSSLQPQVQSELGKEPVASLENDDSWLDEEPVSEEAASVDQPVAADVPDWLSDLQPHAETDTEPEPVAASLADDDIWLDEEPVAAEVTDDQPIAAEVPDWLSNLQPQPDNQPLAALDDDESWLKEVSGMEAEAVVASADDDLWTDDEPVTAQEAITGDSGDFGWLDEVETADTDEADEMDFQPIRKIATDELDAVPALSLADEADDEDDYWLNDEQAELETVNGEPQSEDDINEFEGLTVFPSDEMDMMRDENFEPIPASNAPDWLNAMVPGLDVDFEATEDEPLETEFEGETTMHQTTQSRDFDWVEEIVEEESRQPATTATVAEPANPRYIFSRPPSWMNEPTGPIKEDEELPDWPSDVPEWLR